MSWFCFQLGLHSRFSTRKGKPVGVEAADFFRRDRDQAKAGGNRVDEHVWQEASLRASQAGKDGRNTPDVTAGPGALAPSTLKPVAGRYTVEKDGAVAYVGPNGNGDGLASKLYQVFRIYNAGYGKPQKYNNFETAEYYLLPGGRVLDPATGRVLDPENPRAEIVKRAADSIRHNKMPDERMPPLATLPLEVFEEAETTIRKYSEAWSIPLHKDIVPFPKTPREYQEAARKALGEVPKDAPFGGIAEPVGDKFFIAGIPEMKGVIWDSYRQFYRQGLASELLDKFFDWYRLWAGWHEFFHAMDYSERAKFFKNRHYVDSLFESAVDAESEQYKVFRQAQGERLADASAALAVLDNQRLPEADKERFFQLWDWYRSGNLALHRDAVHDSASTIKILRERYMRAVERYRQAVKDGKIDPARMTPRDYVWAMEQGMIVPGRMTPGDMATMAISVMREQLPKLYEEFNAAFMVAKKATRSSLIDPSSENNHIIDLQQSLRGGWLARWWYNREDFQKVREDFQKDKDKACTDLTNLDLSLPGVPQKLKDVMTASAGLYPGVLSWKEVPDQDIADLQKKAHEARMENCTTAWWQIWRR
jgi:hypothetical protein